MNNSTTGKTFLGQPCSLSILFFAEMWERLSYHDMCAILLFYMYYAVERGGLGMDETTVASIMSIYGLLAFLSIVAGGWLVDRIWGARSIAFSGGVLIMTGHIVLVLPMAELDLCISIAFIAIDIGLLKPNVSNMVGGLHSLDDRRRNAGFSIFVFGINLGSASTPWLVSWTSEGSGLNLFGNHLNFHAGLSLAVVGMFLASAQHVWGGRKYLSDDGMQPADPIDPAIRNKLLKRVLLGVLVSAVVLGVMATLGRLNVDNIIILITIVATALPIYYFVLMFRSPKVTKEERLKVWAYIPLFTAAAIFWGIEESGSAVLALFAVQRTVLHIGNWHFTAANFQTLNLLFIMILTPFFVWLWDNWKKQPSAAGKLAAGLVFTGLSYMWMALPGMLYGTDGWVSPFWLVGSWFIVEIAEILISPIGLSVTTRLVPKAFRSQMMSPWLLADTIGQVVNSQIVRYYSSKTEVAYFLAVGLVGVLFGVVTPFPTEKIHNLMADAE